MKSVLLTMYLTVSKPGRKSHFWLKYTPKASYHWIILSVYYPSLPRFKISTKGHKGQKFLTLGQKERSQLPRLHDGSEQTWTWKAGLMLQPRPPGVLPSVFKTSRIYFPTVNSDWAVALLGPGGSFRNQDLFRSWCFHWKLSWLLDPRAPI